MSLDCNYSMSLNKEDWYIQLVNTLNGDIRTHKLVPTPAWPVKVSHKNCPAKGTQILPVQV